MPIESDNNDAIESPQHRISNSEEHEPVDAASTAPPKSDSALKKCALGLEKFLFRLLSGLMLVAGIALLWAAISIAGSMLDMGHTQNPLFGFGSIIGLFFAVSVGGLGVAMIVGSVLAWTGSLALKFRKSSKGSRVGLLILVVFFIYVIKPQGEDLKSNVDGTLGLLATLAAESEKSQKYHPNGQIRGSESTMDGEKNGLPVKLTVKSRFHANGQISYESHHTDEVYDGLERAWYEDGQLQQESLFVDGERQGLQTEWHENGQKSSKTNFVNDSPVGIKTSWYNNGQKRSEDTYSADTSWSTISWHENGQKRSEENRVSGARDGALRTWYANGQIERESQFEQGREIGEGKHWTETGEPTTR